MLARAVARREPVHVGAEVRDRLQQNGVEWTPELQGQLGEVMGRFVQRGNSRGLVMHDERAFVLSVPERELVDVVSAQADSVGMGKFMRQTTGKTAFWRRWLKRGERKSPWPRW